MIIQINILYSPGSNNTNTYTSPRYGVDLHSFGIGLQPHVQYNHKHSQHRSATYDKADIVQRQRKVILMILKSLGNQQSLSPSLDALHQLKSTSAPADMNLYFYEKGIQWNNPITTI